MFGDGKISVLILNLEVRGKRVEVGRKNRVPKWELGAGEWIIFVNGGDGNAPRGDVNGFPPFAEGAKSGTVPESQRKGECESTTG
jgi:hypothetical protein